MATNVKGSKLPVTEPTVVGLEEKVRALRSSVNLGLRPIQAMDDLMGISPNKVTSKVPEPLELRPAELWVNAEYQRNLSRASVKLIVRMINNWDWRKFKPPVVTLTAENRYVVIDGQHTAIAAATHPDINKIPCMFVKMEDVADQANAFVAHNTARVRVTGLDLFHARNRGGDESVGEIYDLSTRNGVTIVRFVPGSAGLHKPNETAAIGVMEQLYKRYGGVHFGEIMRVIGKCGFAPIRADHLKAIAILLYEREVGEAQLSAELLINLVSGLNDADSRMQAARMAETTNSTKARALANYWRNKYREYHSPRTR